MTETAAVPTAGTVKSTDSSPVTATRENDIEFHSAVQYQGGEGMEFDPFFTENEDYEVTEGNQTSFTKHRQVDLQWKNLGFHVMTKKGGCFGKKEVTTKTILKGISGEVKSGQMLAVMGSSGAGKTTLLNLLAGRLTSSRNYETEGEILVNGKKRDPGKFKRLSAYVEQEDKIFAELTVEEQIAFHASLRLPNKMPKEAKTERVMATIQELGLMKVKDSYVGGESVRGVSGGEKKRVNVGTELVTDPSLIFLDEPTSGLDSFNALNVMFTLKKLAAHGRTVVSTIHQPRSNIFTMFDLLCLLSEGQVMYFGPACDAVTYFSALRFDCPPRFNPADYFIDLLSVDPRNPEAEAKSKKRITYFAEEFHDTKMEMEKGIQAQETVDFHIDKYASNWFHEYTQCFWRSWRLITRERISNIARFGQTVFFSVLLGLIWLNQGRRDWSDPAVQAEYSMSIGGIFFFISINQAFAGVFNVIFVYPLERNVVLKERASATYRVSSYLVSKTMSELPRTVLQVLFFVTLIYWMVGLRADAGAFFVAFYLVLMSQMIAEGLTLCISSVLPDPQAAAAIVPVFIILSMLFGGFLINNDTVPDWIGWIRWISFINYCFSGLLNNQFACDGCGEEVLTMFGTETSLWVCCLAMLGFYLFFRVLWYLILRRNGPKYDHSL